LLIYQAKGQKWSLRLCFSKFKLSNQGAGLLYDGLQMIFKPLVLVISFASFLK